MKTSARPFEIFNPLSHTDVDWPTDYDGPPEFERRYAAKPGIGADILLSWCAGFIFLSTMSYAVFELVALIWRS